MDHRRTAATRGVAVKPDTERPQASAINGKVHLFVGGAHQVMSVAAAEALIPKITDAVEKARQQEDEKP